MWKIKDNRNDWNYYRSYSRCVYSPAEQYYSFWLHLKYHLKTIWFNLFYVYLEWHKKFSKEKQKYYSRFKKRELRELGVNYKAIEIYDDSSKFCKWNKK